MNLRKLLVVGMISAVALGGSLLQASAVTTFASFGFLGPSKFTLTGGNFSVTTNVSFNYVENGVTTLGITLPGSVLAGKEYRATLTMTGSLTGVATDDGFGDLFQSAKNIKWDIKATGFDTSGNATGPAAGASFLAAPIGYTGLFSGTKNGSTAALDSSQPFDNVNFTSGVAGLPPFINEDAGFTFTSVSPVLAKSGNNLRNFTASIVGNFGADAVPEPGTWAMLAGMGATGLVALRRRRR